MDAEGWRRGPDNAERSRLSGIRFEWHEDLPSCLRLRDGWDRSLDAWGVDCVFLRWDWIRVWLRAYRRREKLLVGVARDGEETIGIAPLMIAAEKLGPSGPVLRSVRILGSGRLCPDHLVLPVRPGMERPFAEALWADLRAREMDWDRVELLDLYGDHPAWRALADAIRDGGGSPVIRERTYCPYITLPSKWEEYVKGVSPKTRDSIRYRINRLNRDFEVALLQPQSIEDVDRLMVRLEELHTRGWKERGRAGVFADPRFRRFHRVHARRAFRAGRLWLLNLRAGELDAAVSLGFASRRAFHGYQLGHEGSLQKYGVGTVMVLLAIKSAIETGKAELDFLRGAGAYKSHLTRDVRRGHDLVVHRWTTADRLADWKARGRRRAVAAVRGALGPNRSKRLKRILRME